MKQKIKNYRDLKEFINDFLTDEQLDQPIQIWPEDQVTVFPDTIEITKEDAYASIDYPSEGTFLESDLSEEEFEEQKDRIQVVSKKGTVVLY
jgi:hypothetical protein